MGTQVSDGVLYYPISVREEAIRARVWVEASTEDRCRSNVHFLNWNDAERRCCIRGGSSPPKEILLSHLGEYDISHFAAPFSIEVESRDLPPTAP